MRRKNLSSWKVKSYSEIYHENATMFRNLSKLYEPKRTRVTRRDFRKYTKQAVLMQQNYHCKSCGFFLRFPEFDHIDNDPSNNDYGNCQALCPNCHAEKTRTPIKYPWQISNWFF